MHGMMSIRLPVSSHSSLGKVLGLLVLFALAAFNEVGAVVIFSNPINGDNPSADNPFTAGQIVHANVIASGIGRGSGVFPLATNGRYNANGWDTQQIEQALASNDYFTFTITPDAGYEIDFSNFVFSGTRLATGGASAFALRSSLDGYASNIDIFGVPTGTTVNRTIDLSDSSFQGITRGLLPSGYTLGGRMLAVRLASMISPSTAR